MPVEPCDELALQPRPSATRVENWRPPAESTVPEPASAAPTRMLRSGRSCAPRTSVETRASVSVPDGVSTMRVGVGVATEPGGEGFGHRRAQCCDRRERAAREQRVAEGRVPLIGDGERDAVGWESRCTTSRGRRDRDRTTGSRRSFERCPGPGGRLRRWRAGLRAGGRGSSRRGRVSRRSRLAERARPLVVLRHYAPGPSNRASRSAKSASSESTAPPRIITPYEEGRAVSVGAPRSVTCSAAARTLSMKASTTWACRGNG